MCLGALDEFLHAEVAVAEGGRGFVLCCLEMRGKLIGGANHAHPPAAAAGGGLDDHREAHFSAHSRASSAVGRSSSEPGMMGMPACFMVLRAFSFLSHQAHDLGGGSDELQVEASQTSAKLAFSLSKP